MESEQLPAAWHTPKHCQLPCGPYPCGQVTLTDTSYELILSASGPVIDQCPDKALLEEVTRTLLPIQRGEAAPAIYFSPTMAEMALWLQSEQGHDRGQMTQTM